MFCPDLIVQNHRVNLGAAADVASVFLWEGVETYIDVFMPNSGTASFRPLPEIGVEGYDYEVIRDTPGRPAIIRLLGNAGTEAEIRLVGGGRRFRRAVLDGSDAHPLLAGRAVRVDFPGVKLARPAHRKLGDLEPCPVPEDAEALFEATCFAADSNALEVRSLFRSGPTSIPQVQAARTAFFFKPMFVNRGIWDRNLFDGRLDTSFIARLPGRSFRLDFGRPLRTDRIVLRVRNRQAADISPDLDRFADDGEADVSADLETWHRLAPSWGGKGTIAVLRIPRDLEVRFLRIKGAPRSLSEVEAYLEGRPLDRSGWRASNLFGAYSQNPAVAAWRLSVPLDDVPRNARLAVALNGRHGSEGAYAALRADGRPVGAPDRAVSFPGNTWEYFNAEADGGYAYYFPVSEAMVGKTVEVVVLILRGGTNAIRPEAWLSAYPDPRESRRLVLHE